MNQTRELFEEKNINVNPSARASMWQALSPAMPRLALIFGIPLISVLLAIFIAYVIHDPKGFAATTPILVLAVYILLGLLALLAIFHLGVKVIVRNLLVGLAELRVLNARADREKNFTDLLLGPGGQGFFTLNEEGLIEAGVLPAQQQVRYNVRAALPAPGDVVDADDDELYDEEYVEEDEVEAPPEASGVEEDECLNLSPAFHPHADTVLSGRGTVFGISGSGKSNTIATLSEELGQQEVPLILADTEDEYQSLNHPRWFPNGHLMNAQHVTVANAANFGRYVIEHLWQVILNLQSYAPDEAALVMARTITGMRQWEEERASEHRVSCMFILDEAAFWLPQQVQESKLSDKSLLAVQQAFFDDLVRRGRKRGLGLVLATQRSAEIDKRALQSNWKVLHRQTEEADLKRYVAMGITKEETLALRDGEAFVFNAQVSKLRVQMRLRYSKHGADTPGLASVRRYQREIRNFGEYDEPAFGNQDDPETSRIGFDQPMEPLRSRSKTSEIPGEPSAKIPPAETSEISDTGGQTWYNVPSKIRSEILKRYRSGVKRTAIQNELELNGDQYWMVKVVCDGWDNRTSLETKQA